MNKIEELIGYGREQGCSDIHLTFGSEPVMRRMGELVTLKGYGVMNDETLFECADIVLKEAGGKMSGEVLEDYDICYETQGGSRNRINIYHQQNHVAMAIRLLNEHIPTIEELNLPEKIKEITGMSQGLVLVNGPAGSGKSTALAAMIHEINATQGKHILTVEDPVEYRHKNMKSIVNQREVGTDLGSFAQGVRSALREDADVILVGALQDTETILAALTAAETGHLVFSALHIAGAEESVSFIVDLFPPHQKQQIRARLKSSLKAVVTREFETEGDKSSRNTEIMILTEE
ncbi:MAG: Flp pilus assembly complex ATPase component TadA [Roseburia sp.]|nr:Flp pilus assembly complex ATPase component TadA [Roseburia sp.]